MYYVNIRSAVPIVRLDVPSGAHPTYTEMVEKSPVLDQNLQEQLLLDYNQKWELTLQEWVEVIADKKSLMIIIFSQYNDATRTNITLGASYKADCEAGELI